MATKEKKSKSHNFRTFLLQFIGRPAYLVMRGDYYELSIQSPDREDDFELTSQANMESTLYKIIGAHDDFVLLLEETLKNTELAVSYSFLKKIQVIS